MPGGSSLKGMDRVQQIKRLQDCVFMVRSFTK
jgi:serine protease Do